MTTNYDENEVWWSWKYLSSLKSLTLTIHNIMDSDNGDCFVINLGSNGLFSSRSVNGFSSICYSRSPLSISFPKLRGAILSGSCSPTCSLSNGIISITWSCTTIVDVCHFNQQEQKTLAECKNCGAQLISHSAQFKCLPSEYWDELLDSWSCHRQEFAGITKDLPDPLKLSPSDSCTVLYSTHHFLMKVNDNFIVTEDIAKCVKCLYTLGCTSKTDVVDIPVLRTRSSPGVQKYISWRIYETMQAHSSFYFCINQQLHLHLINWSCFISTRNSDCLFPVVLLLNAPADDGSSEHIDIFDDDFAELLDILSEQEVNGMSYLIL